MSKKLNILVTGATGFIGRHVLDRLREENVSVTVLSRDLSRLSDLKNCYDHAIEMNIADASDNIYELTGSPDILIHLAWEGLPDYYSLHHYEQVLPQQYTFLKSMISGGLKSILVTGTCFEYGMQNGCLSEDAPAMPDNPYGFAKDTLHRQLLYLNKEIPFVLTWCRLFYIWGEGQSEKSLYSQLSAAIARGDRIFNMSEGDQLRDYLHVKDIADYLVQLALKNNKSVTVNIGSGRPISIRKLIENWIELNHWNIELNPGFYPYPTYEPMEFWADTTRLKQLLNQ